MENISALRRLLNLYLDHCTRLDEETVKLAIDSLHGELLRFKTNVSIDELGELLSLFNRDKQMFNDEIIKLTEDILKDKLKRISNPKIV